MNLTAVKFYKLEALRLLDQTLPQRLRERGVSDDDVKHIDAVRDGVMALANEVYRLRRLLRKHGGRP